MSRNLESETQNWQTSRWLNRSKRPADYDPLGSGHHKNKRRSKPLTVSFHLNNDHSERSSIAASHEFQNSTSNLTSIEMKYDRSKHPSMTRTNDNTGSPSEVTRIENPIFDYITSSQVKHKEASETMRGISDPNKNNTNNEDLATIPSYYEASSVNVHRSNVTEVNTIDNHSIAQSFNNDYITPTTNSIYGADSSSVSNMSNLCILDGTDNSIDMAANRQVLIKVLVRKLREVYQAIIRQEIEVQEMCNRLKSHQIIELTDLLEAFKLVKELVNNYSTFIITCLSPAQTEFELSVGKEFVDTYKVEKRLWMYGSMAFMDVLMKSRCNVDTHLNLEFVTFVFASILNIAALVAGGTNSKWYQHLGHLAGIASTIRTGGNLIDWKLCAFEWYNKAKVGSPVSGKLHYLTCTLQKNPLESLVDLGISMTCKDAFVIPQRCVAQLLEGVMKRSRAIDEQTFSHLKQYLDSMSLLVRDNKNMDNTVREVTLNYFLNVFGCDYNNENIFIPHNMFLQKPEVLKFYFKYSASFAILHISQLFGIGNYRNPFAILFDMPKYLKLNSMQHFWDMPHPIPENLNNGSNKEGGSNPVDNFFEDVAETDLFFKPFESVRVLKKSLEYVSSSSIMCSMIVLKKFMMGPFVVALPHLIPWACFLKAIGLKLRKANEDCKLFWNNLIRRLFPWNTIVNFLNILKEYLTDNIEHLPLINQLYKSYFPDGTNLDLDKIVENYNLPELRKCHGTLWFDELCTRDEAEIQQGSIYQNVMEPDLPYDGIPFEADDEYGTRFLKRACKVISLFQSIAVDNNFGLCTTSPRIPVNSIQQSTQNGSLLSQFIFKLKDAKDIDISFNGDALPDASSALSSLYERTSPTNLDLCSPINMSVAEGENIFNYIGYKKLTPDYYFFDRHGMPKTFSLYTQWVTPSREFTADIATEFQDSTSREFEYHENFLFDAYFTPLKDRLFINQSFNIKNYLFWMSDDDSYNNELDYYSSVFVLDATSWLKHYAHIYKIAQNRVLRFGVCVTTYYEVLFLSSSKDISISEAASRCVIVLRQLRASNDLMVYNEDGTINDDNTFRDDNLNAQNRVNCVDQFVLEAIGKCQSPYIAMRNTGTSSGTKQLLVVLVSDDHFLSKRSRDRMIRTCGTRLIFALCSKLGHELGISMN